MSKFTFDRGTWKDGNSMPEWQDNEDLSSYLNRSGYATARATFGCEDGGEFKVYESSDGKSFYALVCPLGDTCFDVLLPDFPSLMMFIRDHAAAFAAESVNFTQQQALTILEKLFQAQHGHDAYSICQQCDPLGWEKLRALEVRRKKREAKG